MNKKIKKPISTMDAMLLQPKEIIKIYDKMTFESEIEIMVDNGMNYLEAVISFCETKGLEFNNIKRLLSETLLSKIKQQAIDLNYFKGKKSIDIKKLI